MADAVVSEVSLQVFLSLLHFNRGIFFVFRPYVRDYFPICFAVWFIASLEITAIKFVASFTCVTRIIIWFAVRMAARVAERSGVRIADWLMVRITNQVTCMITGRVADWIAAWFAVRIAERVTDTIADRVAAWFAVRIADRVAAWLAVRIADRIVIKITSRFTSMVHTRFSITIITEMV